MPAEPTFRDIIWTSNKKQWDIVTHDAALVQWVYDDGFPFQRSLVFLQLEGGEVEQDAAIMRLFERYKRLTPGRMYTVTGSRVKIRQLPTGPRGKAPPGRRVRFGRREQVLQVNRTEHSKMSLLVTGSIGVDTLETPYGKREDVIGGSAVYFSFAARLFTPVRLVGVVGEDVPPGLLEVFKGYPIDTAGLEVRKGSRTFRWHGSYVDNMNEAVTMKVQLNVLAEQGPTIPKQFCDSRFVFLANTHPPVAAADA